MTAEQSRTCAKCGERPPGEGGVLCPTCAREIEERMAGYWHQDGDEPAEQT
ncbi:hypothetical protein [Actinophytocola sp.]|uniref:hypothetical protein n=1 Tax=Actinophytocola sp. TaxID=1872138 RepID=UPI003899F477